MRTFTSKISRPVNKLLGRFLQHHVENSAYYDIPIFIVGLPRSGTSLVAGLIKTCGAWSGSTVPAGTYNPKGFFENKQIRDGINKPLLANLGGDEAGVTELPSLEDIPLSISLRSDIARVLAEQGFTGRSPWMFKDAKLSLTWPAFAAAFPKARWLIVNRQIDDVVDSCLRTPFMARHSKDPEFWREWAANYIYRIEALKASGAKFWQLDADLLISGELAQFQSVTRDLELTWNEKAIRGFISPNYWKLEK
jgi:hypothetical protein